MSKHWQTLTSVERTHVNYQQVGLRPTKWCFDVTFIGPDLPTHEAFLVHEPAGCWDLAVRFGRLSPRQLHPLRHGEVLPLWVEQPSPLSRREWRSGKPVLCVKQFLVYHWDLPQTGVGFESEGEIFRIYLHDNGSCHECSSLPCRNLYEANVARFALLITKNNFLHEGYN